MRSVLPTPTSTRLRKREVAADKCVVGTCHALLTKDRRGSMRRLRTRTVAEETTAANRVMRQRKLDGTRHAHRTRIQSSMHEAAQDKHHARI
eukprot:690487-Pleurochrysis_carterae.AAC.1